MTAAASREKERAGGAAPPWISRNVLLLGLVSFFNDTSSEVILPLLPAFLTGTLGAGALALGGIEGVADATASVIKFFSGRWSDRLGRYKPWVLGGYGFSSLARPLVALAAAPWHVLAVRTVDRLGKGLRTSPRDALIAASCPPGRFGAAYGLNRAMDHAGAVLGPALAAGILALGCTNLRLLFALAAIPGLAAVASILAVREESKGRGAAAPLPPPAPDASAPEGSPREGAPSLVRLLLPFWIFTLGNGSDVFLLLKAGAVRSPLVAFPLLWIGLHVTKMLVSAPAGRMADRFGPRRMIALGWLVYAAVYAAFAFTESRVVVAVLFVVYGCYHGLAEGPEKAWIAGIAPRGRTGTAFGWYHLVQGGGVLAASLLFGGIWEFFGSRAAFLTGAGLALAALVALLVLTRGGRRVKGAVKETGTAGA